MSIFIRRFSLFYKMEQRYENRTIDVKNEVSVKKREKRCEYAENEPRK